MHSRNWKVTDGSCYLSPGAQGPCQDFVSISQTDIHCNSQIWEDTVTASSGVM
jgi:hypothetical protein